MSLLDDLRGRYEQERERIEAAAGRRANRFRGQRPFPARRRSWCPTCGLRLSPRSRIICVDLWDPETGVRKDGVGFCLDCAQEQGWSE
jgi:hypothetical protein